MKKVLLFVSMTLLIACNNKKSDIKYDIALANVKTYIATKMDDFKTIDSLKLVFDTVTEKSRLQDQIFEYTFTKTEWEIYNIKEDILHTNYSEDYKRQQINFYSKLVEELKKKLSAADSSSFVLWQVHFWGILTNSDMTQKQFKDNVYMTKDYKIVPKTSVIDFGNKPYSKFTSDDRILTMNYPYLEPAVDDIDSIPEPINY